MPAVDRNRVTASLPGYAVGRELGSGAFGLVCAGHHLALDRDVAIKILSVALDADDVPDAAADFNAQAWQLGGLDHPHIAVVRDFVGLDDLWILVTDLVPGGCLTGQQLSPEGVLAVGLAVADGLDLAHGLGVLHRDLKPDNILFTTSGQPKITDFGVAKILDGKAGTSGWIVGSPRYMAPEQITGNPLGPPADLYALAVVLYEQLTGSALFDPTLTVPELFRHHCEVTPAPPVGVPAPVGDVLLRALAKNPADRPATAHDFALDLARAAATAYGPRWATRSGVLVHVPDQFFDVPDQLLDRVDEPKQADEPKQVDGPIAPDAGATVLLERHAEAEGSATMRLERPDAPARPAPADHDAPGGAAGDKHRSRRWHPAAAFVAAAVTAAVAALVVTTSGGSSPTEPAAPPAASVSSSTTPSPTTVAPPVDERITITTFAGNGREGATGDGGPAVEASFARPFGPAVDGAENVYVPDFDNHRIRRIDPAGVVTTVVGTGTPGSTGDGGPATEAMLNSPAAVAFDQAGTMYIADTFNHRIRKVDRFGVITTVAGNGDAGTTYADDGAIVPAVDVSLWYPSGVAADAAGNVYIADSATNLVRRVDREGLISTVAGVPGFGGVGVEGSFGDGGPAAAALVDNPFSVAVDPAGNIYFADHDSHRIRRVDPDGTITTVAGTGLRGYSGDGGPATEAELSGPRGVAVDAAGNIYVTDAGNVRIRRVDPDGIITTVAGNGQPEFAGDGGPAALAGFESIDGAVAVDAAGNIYVTDRRANRIRIVTASG